MDLTVDPDGLRADAAALEGSADSRSAAWACQAAASDAVSAHLATALTAWAQSLHLLLEHAGKQRTAGGLAVSGTAAALSGADTDNAAAINGILNGSSAPSAAAAAPSPAGIADIPLPSLPALPSLAPPTPMAPEQIAALVHSGPGPGSLRAFAGHIRTALAPTVLDTAANVRSTGTSVGQNWRDGHQQAASNIASHADWLESSLHPQMLALASAADAAARHTDTLIQNTPHPQEFTDLRQRLNVALAHYNASGGANAAQVEALSSELTKKRASAVGALQNFATAAPPTISTAAQPPPPAPPIVHNDPGEFKKLHPAPPPERTRHDDGPADGREHRGEDSTEPENSTATDHAAPTGAATPPAAPGAAAPTTPAAPAAPSSASTLANLAGMIMGAGTGAVGQVTHGLGGGASPLSALSSLSSLPGLGGMPHMGTPQLPEGGGPDSSPADDFGGGDFGSGGTSPASGGGEGGGVGGGAPMSSSSPAVGPPAGSSVSVGGPGGGATSTTGGTVGGMGMMPPMMGGMGGKNDEPNKSEDRRRVVMRPVANTEPVIGEVRREPRRRRDPDQKT